MKSHDEHLGGRWQAARRVSALSVVLLLMALPRAARADYVLLQDGRTLFNVVADDGVSTAAGPMRVRTRPGSFGYDPRTGTVFMLPRHSQVFNVADVMSTTTEFGKGNASALVREHRWQNYRAPLPPPLVAPTPEATPVALVVSAASEVVLPINVVPESVPLKERVQQQLDMFVKEQSRLAADLGTSVSRGVLSLESAQELRVRFIDRQREVLQRYYPAQSSDVQWAVQAWDRLRQRVVQNARFDVEAL